MSLRTFTVFQDAVSSEAPPKSKVTRPNAMITRRSSSSLNLTTSSSSNATTLAVGPGSLVALDKENFHPVTGERAGHYNNTGSSKKRKNSVLATKVQPPLTTTTTAKKDTQPEKKHKASTSTKGKVKRIGKVTVTARKGSSKRTISRKVSPMPKVNEEEEEAKKDRITQVNIDARCYELTVQPLADVSQAYEEGAAFEGIPTSSCEAKLKFNSANTSSAEPGIRDYFEPSHALLSSSTSRFRSMSREIPEGRTFSTPERKQIYSAFTFSSPSASSGRMSKLSRSTSPSPSKCT